MARIREVGLCVQGGAENGDRSWLLRASPVARHSWVVPKSAATGHEVVIYVGTDGLFATAKIVSSPKARLDWPNRYGPQISTVRLIGPPISLSMLRKSHAQMDDLPAQYRH